jgi:CHAT domain-containing protein/uncharacterized protein HemY
MATFICGRRKKRAVLPAPEKNSACLFLLHGFSLRAGFCPAECPVLKFACLPNTLLQRQTQQKAGSGLVSPQPSFAHQEGKMTALRRSFRLAVIVALLFALTGQAQEQKEVIGDAARAAPEEAALRAVTEKFFTAYAGKDLEGIMALWSEKSPDLASARQKFRQELNSGDYRFTSPAFSRLKSFPDKTSFRLTIEQTAIDPKTKQSGQQTLFLNLEMVSEGGQWKFWRYALATEDLATAIVTAGTDEERGTLLLSEKELVTPGLVEALIRQGTILSDKGTLPRAAAILLYAGGIAEKIGYKHGLASILLDLGTLHLRQGAFDRALESYQQAIPLFAEQKRLANLAKAQGNIGIIYAYQGEYGRAAEFFRKSLEQHQALNDELGVAGKLQSLGELYRLQGEYKAAQEYLAICLPLAEKLKDRDRELFAIVLGNLGTLNAEQGNFSAAAEYFHRSLKEREGLGNKARIAVASGNLGRLYVEQGNYRLALEYLQRSLRLNQEVGALHQMVNARMGIADLYFKQGRPDLALENYQESLKLAQALNLRREIAMILLNIGSCYGSLKNAGMESDYYEKALAANPDPATRAMILGQMASDKVSQGEYAKAAEYFQQSLSLQTEMDLKGNQVYVLGEISLLHFKQGDYQRALSYAERAATLARQISAPEELWFSLYRAGQAHLGLNNPTEARQAFEEAIAVIESLRDSVAGGVRESQQHFANKTSPYRELVGLLVAQNQPAEALAYAERARARVLLDVLKSGRLDIARAMTTQEKEEEQKLRTELVSLNRQITRENAREKPDEQRIADLKARLRQAQLAYEQFEVALYASHPDLRVRRGEATVLTLKEAAQLLPDEKAALLEFVVTDKQSWLFVLTRSAAAKSAPVSVRAFSIEAKESDLTAQVEEFRRSLAERNNRYGSLSTQLYKLLLEPAQALLKGKTSLVIVPDGALWELPFQALLTPANRYLIEDAAIARAPSLTVLREMAKPKRKDAEAPASLLALGNPALGNSPGRTAVLQDEKLEALPDTERQVRLLGGLYPDAQRKVYVGAEATEERFKAEASGYRILHLATHGILDDRSPMYSHLVLSQTAEKSKEDGLLEAWEILNLDLKADLAVLSACETARGRVSAGEGMIGLSWVLFVAGVPTTVVSQWKVRSDSTADLMIEFHRQLSGKAARSPRLVTKAEALRQAALKVMANSRYRHPFYWAGFALMGDWQ